MSKKQQDEHGLGDFEKVVREQREITVNEKPPESEEITVNEAPDYSAEIIELVTKIVNSENWGKKPPKTVQELKQSINEGLLEPTVSLLKSVVEERVNPDSKFIQKKRKLARSFGDSFRMFSSKNTVSDLQNALLKDNPRDMLSALKKIELDMDIKQVVKDTKERAKAAKKNR